MHQVNTKRNTVGAMAVTNAKVTQPPSGCINSPFYFVIMAVSPFHGKNPSHTLVSLIDFWPSCPAFQEVLFPLQHTTLSLPASILLLSRQSHDCLQGHLDSGVLALRQC